MRAVPVAEPPPGRRTRLRSIDAFRGAVLAFMVLTPASGDPATYPFLRHAAWDGPTASDLVLPTFLVTSGLSLAFLLRPPVGRPKVVRLVRRLVLLVLLGLAYNAYGATGTDLSALRFTGVLQLIGIAGALAAAVVLVSRRGDDDRPWVVAAVAGALPALYGAGLVLLDERCGGAEACSPYGRWDRDVLGEAHAYAGGDVRYDPEGLAVCVAATSLVLVGYLAGRLLVRASSGALGRAVAEVAGAGTALLAVAWVLDGWQPANKRLFTPAFVSLSAGVALLGVAAFVVILDVRRRGAEDDGGGLASPLVGLGRNALVVYLLERVLLQTSTFVHVGDRTVRDAILDALPGSETSVHLAFTAAVLAIIVVVTSTLHASRRYLAL